MDEKIETDRDGGDGNTNPPLKPKKKQVSQLIDWEFCWNNYPVDAVETLLKVFRNLCKAYQFQSEIGEQGTPHLQGMIKCKKSMRWTEFKLPKQISWRKTRNEKALLSYTLKDDTFDIKANIRQSYGYPEPLIYLKEVDFRPWQKELFNIVSKNADDRHIHWIYDEKGGKGKSQFARHMGIIKGTPVLRNMKTGDIASYFIKNNIDITNCVIFDFPKQTEKINYNIIETMKDGYIMSGKFEGGCKYFNPPHLIVFSNELPTMNKTLSLDRFIIHEITDEFTLQEIKMIE